MNEGNLLRGKIEKMEKIYLTNSLTNKKEELVPVNPPNVGVYTCGPTVYDYAHIGNFRTYVVADILTRLITNAGYKLNYVMNITDVGHLTGDNLGDADTGEDRLEKSSKKEGKTAWQIADFYTKVFMEDMKELNIKAPNTMPRATEHIKDQISLIEKLEKNGLTYKTSDGIYFDTVAYEKTGRKYGELSTLDQIREGVRVEKNPEKKNPRDFALWKFSPKDVKRQMEWESPWGVGFPGWHVECSAMSMKYLGDTFDIHIGGEDLRQTHHPNEIAQSEGATGKPFVKYWIHITHLLVDGKKMSKSKGNAFNLKDVMEKGFEPLSLRYLYLTANYRDPLNFTWESLEAAQNALYRLRDQVSAYRTDRERTSLSEEKREKMENYSSDFFSALDDDINTPKAISALWEMMKSNIPSVDKYDLIESFDEVLGLSLTKVSQPVEIPGDVIDLSGKREELREAGEFEKADEIRKQINDRGFSVKDTPGGPQIRPIRKTS